MVLWLSTKGTIEKVAWLEISKSLFCDEFAIDRDQVVGIFGLILDKFGKQYFFGSATLPEDKIKKNSNLRIIFHFMLDAFVSINCEKQ